MIMLHRSSEEQPDQVSYQRSGSSCASDSWHAVSSSHDEDAHDDVDDDGDDDEAVDEDDEDEQVDVGGDLTSYLSIVSIAVLV